MTSSALRKTLVMVLAGGQGERLQPLTKDRAKPAVPFGGAYRIIDFTLSNCLNSGLSQIYLLTQYRSVSLHRHILVGWTGFFNPSLGQFIDLVPPQQRAGDMWYRGTADAIFHNIYLLEQDKPDHVLILGGDHVYKMDYASMLQTHLDAGAVLTVGCIEVPREDARRFGVMSVDAGGRIVAFDEKPPNPKPIPGKESHALASMGIYIFDTRLLVRALIADARADTSHDFGKNIIPGLVEAKEPVFAHRFHEPEQPERNYWRDIGTLDSYYEANMDLVSSTPLFDLYDDRWPIRTFQPPLPPARVVSERDAQAVTENSLLAPGAMVQGARVRNSILSPHVVVERDAEVEGSLILEGVRIGAGARVYRSIIDKNVVIPCGDKIGVSPEEDKRRFKVTDDGIVVIPKGIVLS